MVLRIDQEATYIQKRVIEKNRPEKERKKGQRSQWWTAAKGYKTSFYENQIG